MAKYSSYSKYVNFINKYKKASNASSGSEVDANANVENKNVATMQGELPKRDLIGTNRLLMWNKFTRCLEKIWRMSILDSSKHTKFINMTKLQ